MKEFLKKWLPKPKTIKEQKSISWLGKFLSNSYIWKINRNSIAGGVAVGLFINFLPIPLQMLLAALAAIVLHVNLPMAVLMTWINNPITIIPLNYLIYRIGAWVIGTNNSTLSPKEFAQYFKQMTHFWHEFGQLFKLLWKPFLVGLPIVCFGSAIIGFLIVQLVWKIFDLFSHQKKSKTREQK